MGRTQFWIMINACLAIVAGAMTPWLLRSPQTDVQVKAAVEPELPVAEFANAERVKPQTDLMGTKNLFHPGRGVQDPDAPAAAPAPAPTVAEQKLALQSIGRINNLACANIKVDTATQIVPLGKQVAGTDWRLIKVSDRSAVLQDGQETLMLTVGVGL